MKLAPVCLFLYNRPFHTKQCIESLLKNNLSESSELFIFSDAPKSEKQEKNVQEVRSYIKSITGFKRINIIEREFNYGLAQNIIDGVTTIVSQFNKVIVLEDDLLVSPYFLEYMNNFLEIYKEDHFVASIHGYVYPLKNLSRLPETFFIKGADCWGWATWKRAWDYFEKDGSTLLKEILQNKLKKEFDFDNSYPYTRMLLEQTKGENNSWAIRWYASAFLNNMYTLYPRESLVKNIGMDNSGTHCGSNNFYETNLITHPIVYTRQPIIECKEARKEFVRYFHSLKYKSWLQKINNIFRK